MLQRVMSIFVEVLLSHSAKNFQGEPVCAVTQICSGSEKVYVKDGGVVKRFSVEKFCLRVPKKFAGSPIGFLYFRVSEVFMLQRVMSRLSIENISPQSAKNFGRGIFLGSVPETSR